MNNLSKFIKENPKRSKAAVVGIPLVLLVLPRGSIHWPIFEVDPIFAMITLSILTIISVTLNGSYIKNCLLLCLGVIFAVFINTYLLTEQDIIETFILGLLCGLVVIFIFSYIPDLSKEYSRKRNNN